MEQSVVAIYRHALATLAYRANVAWVGAPDDYWTFDAGQGVRTPAEILGHMVGLLQLMHAAFSDSPAPSAPQAAATNAGGNNATDWATDIQRFHELIALIDAELEEGRDWVRFSPLIILQGPIADCLTHIGQLHLLRRLAGSPSERVSYLRVDVLHAVAWDSGK